MLKWHRNPKVPPRLPASKGKIEGRFIKVVEALPLSDKRETGSLNIRTSNRIKEINKIKRKKIPDDLSHPTYYLGA